MTSLFHSFQTLNFPERLRLLKLNCPKSILFLVIAAAASGCSSVNYHRELFADPSVLVRKWTVSTRTNFEAGDRGTEFSNPLMVDNTLIFGNQSVGLTAVYPSLLKTRWTVPIKGGVISELSVHGGNV